MIDVETKRKARELKVPGLTEALEVVANDPSYIGISNEECLKLVIDHVYQAWNHKQIVNLINRAHLRLPEADISNIDYEGRPIDRDLVLWLGTAQFVSCATDIVLQGFSGTGKSHLACALGKQACKQCITTLYTRMPDMFAYREEKLEGGWSERKILTRFVSPRLLIADEFMLDETTPEETHFLLELVERRHDKSSTIWCSQYGTDDWHPRLGGGAHAEAVLDRIVHNCIKIEMGDVNMRERMALRDRALASTKLGVNNQALPSIQLEGNQELPSTQLDG